MNIDEKKLELINRGREAEIVLQIAGDRIKKASLRKLEEMKIKYKSGQIDQPTLQSGLASICALDDLYAELVRDVTTGNKASKDIHDHTRSANGDSNPGYPGRG